MVELSVEPVELFVKITIFLLISGLPESLVQHCWLQLICHF